MWITVDGKDMSGKTSAVQYLSILYQQAGHKTIVVRGMGTGLLGARIRELLFEEYLNQTTIAASCAVALLDCYSNVKRLLDAGYVVISDRFIASYYAYNVAANQDLGADLLFTNILTNPAIITTAPDLALYIQTTNAIAASRLAARPASEVTCIDIRSDEYFDSVSTGFDIYKQLDPSKRIKTILNDSSIESFKQQLTQAIAC